MKHKIGIDHISKYQAKCNGKENQKGGIPGLMLSLIIGIFRTGKISADSKYRSLDRKACQKMKNRHIHIPQSQRFQKITGQEAKHLRILCYSKCGITIT